MAEDEDKIICRCEEITEKAILEAIGEGCDSVTWVKRKTRAGMGLCQGRTCGRLVARMVAEQTGQDIAEILPDTRRPPVRPIPLDILEETDYVDQSGRYVDQSGRQHPKDKR